MAFWNRKAVAETDAPATQRAAPRRTGFDPDIPAGGTTVTQQSASSVSSRKQEMDDLFAAYVACPPASTAVDAIARTITAGGLDIVKDTDGDEQLEPTPKTVPANVQAVKDLIGYVNPMEDIRQLLRNIVVDLLVAGDAFVEVTWLLGVPVALWHLDSATMIPKADTHGVITGYWQDCGTGRQAWFLPHEIIHIRFDAPRGGVYGMSPTRKLQPAILSYIWTLALLKETMRKGNPPRFHMKFGEGEDIAEIKRFRQSYSVRHLGPTNIGTPLISKGAEIQEFKMSAIAEYLSTLSDLRDIQLSGYGVPPRKVGVAEPGSLGGQGAPMEADKTFRLNTCGPTGELILEKLNFVILQAYGVEGWKIKFGEVDYRDDLVLEQLRDMRLRNGTWTQDRYRDDIGEPPVEGGDIPVLVDRQNLIAWSDLPALSKATVAATQAKGPTAAAPEDDETPAKPGQSKPGAGIASLPPAVGQSEAWNRYWAAFEDRQRGVLRSLHEYGPDD